MKLVSNKPSEELTLDDIKNLVTAFNNLGFEAKLLRYNDFSWEIIVNKKQKGVK